jgi:outer membrane protein OmpA-like peptidoglycan-associated protein
LEIEWGDDSILEERVKPLFDEILTFNLSKEDSKTIEIVASYLAEIISVSSKQNLNKLSKSLQAVISPAISKEIENNKDKMIDALYPIMGGMISKYVTQSIKELMESINHKIEDGLSINRYKRKIKSKLTGVSEVELLLEESSDAKIESILVIHKETGLLIAQAHRDKELDDAMMIASMASAIKDFVNDWIQNQNEEHLSEVQILSYGNATLYIESAGSVYMIAFMDAEPDFEQRKEINLFFGDILQRYSTLFHNFDGDNSDSDIPPLESELYSFLECAKDTVLKPKENSNLSKYILYMLLVLGVGYGVDSIYDRYKIYNIEQEIREKVSTQVRLLKLSDSSVEVYGYIDDISKYYQIEKILHKHKYSKIFDYLKLPSSYTDVKIKGLSDELKRVVTHYDREFFDINRTLKQVQSKNVELKLELKGLKDELIEAQKSKERLEYIAHLKRYILDDLKNVFVDNPYYHIDDGSLDFHIQNLFLPAQTKANPKKLSLVAKDYTKYITTILSDDIRRGAISHIIIEGYTDSSGNAERNMLLSSKRAENIKNYLMGLDVSRELNIVDKFISIGKGATNPIIKDGVEDKNESRRIKIRFELNKN